MVFPIILGEIIPKCTRIPEANCAVRDARETKKPQILSTADRVPPTPYPNCASFQLLTASSPALFETFHHHKTPNKPGLCFFPARPPPSSSDFVLMRQLANPLLHCDPEPGILSPVSILFGLAYQDPGALPTPSRHVRLHHRSFSSIVGFVDPQRSCYPLIPHASLLA